MNVMEKMGRYVTTKVTMEVNEHALQAEPAGAAHAINEHLEHLMLAITAFTRQRPSTHSQRPHVERPHAQKIALAEAFCVLLNELVELDPDAMQNLMTTYHRCNAAFGHHPTVQVAAVGNGGVHPMVGVLGLLNGLIGAKDESGWGYLQAEFEASKLVRFKVDRSV